MTTNPSRIITISPKLIACTDRQRTDLGDIDALADSIRRFGQLQPVLVTEENRLVAGGRRIAACIALNIDVLAMVDSSLKPSELDMLELEENVRRKSLTWQEEVLAIAKIHDSQIAAQSLNHVIWLPRMTGELLGVSKSSVYNATELAKHLLVGDEAIMQCAGPRDALQLILKRRAQHAENHLVSRLKPATATSAAGPHTVAEATIESPSRAKRHIEIVHGKACEWLLTQKDGSLNCVYTDPPYAIEMGNISQVGGGMDTSDVADTHVVTDNVAELTAFVDLVSTKLVPGNGFLGMWCDFWNFRWLAERCLAAGLVVQRWPLVWVKQSTCQNMAAAYNFTKTTEACLIARTPKSMLVSAQTKGHFSCANEKPDWITNPFFKPLELHEWVLKGIATPGTVVVDTYGGCGSIPLACIGSHYDALMVEMDDAHIAALKGHLA